MGRLTAGRACGRGRQVAQFRAPHHDAEEMHMPAFMREANNYFVALYPQAGGSGRINLYCLDGYRLYLIFKPNAASTPNSYDAATKTGVAYADTAQFPNYLDLVRNEKPVNVTFNPDVSPPSFVVHASEPVGEGEM